MMTPIRRAVIDHIMQRGQLNESAALLLLHEVALSERGSVTGWPGFMHPIHVAEFYATNHDLIMAEYRLHLRRNGNEQTTEQIMETLRRGNDPEDDGVTNYRTYLSHWTLEHVAKGADLRHPD